MGSKEPGDDDDADEITAAICKLSKKLQSIEEEPPEAADSLESELDDMEDLPDSLMAANTQAIEELDEETLSSLGPLSKHEQQTSMLILAKVTCNLF